MSSVTKPVTRIALWGPTQVGKTALLATALYGDDPHLSHLIRQSTAGDVNTHLFDVHKRLMSNQFVPPTAIDEVVISLGPEERLIQLVDVRGARVLDLQRPQVQDVVRGMDAILFVSEYDGPDAGRQMAAIDAALIEHGDRPIALALTKCEQWLRHEDEAWDGPTDWLRSSPHWTSHQRTLSRFTQCAWVTSAFGYDSATNLPAVILGEMGQILPYRINPRNVTLPFVWLLGRLGCL
jgi:hypothetical protein